MGTSLPPARRPPQAHGGTEQVGADGRPPQAHAPQVHQADVSLHPGSRAQHLPTALPQTLEQDLHRALGDKGRWSGPAPVLTPPCVLLPGSPSSSWGQAPRTGSGLPRGAVVATGYTGRTAHWPGPSPSPHCCRCCNCPAAAPGAPARTPGQALRGHARPVSGPQQAQGALQPPSSERPPVHLFTGGFGGPKPLRRGGGQGEPAMAAWGLTSLARGRMNREVLCGEAPGRPGRWMGHGSLPAWGSEAPGFREGRDIHVFRWYLGEGALLAPPLPQGLAGSGPGLCPSPTPCPAYKSHLGCRLLLGPPAGGGWWTGL